MTRAQIWKKLDGKGRKAMQGSVRKWIKIVLGTGKDMMGKNCPLCQFSTSCRSCPIGMYNDGGCGVPPYRTWSKHLTGAHAYVRDAGVLCAQCLVFAKAELRFLAGFLPKDDKLQVSVKKALKVKWDRKKKRVMLDRTA